MPWNLRNSEEFFKRVAREDIKGWMLVQISMRYDDALRRLSLSLSFFWEAKSKDWPWKNIFGSRPQALTRLVPYWKWRLKNSASVIHYLPGGCMISHLSCIRFAQFRAASSMASPVPLWVVGGFCPPGSCSSTSTKEKRKKRKLILHQSIFRMCENCMRWLTKDKSS
jgi:hypothetical protein